MNNNIDTFKNSFGLVHDMINQSSLSFIAPLVFFGLFLIAFGVGYWNGRRTSIYFMIGIAISFAIGVIFLFFLDDIVINLLSKLDFSLGSLTMSDLVERGVTYIKSLVGGLILLAIILFIFLIQWLIYPFFRKKLKSKIKDQRKNGLSTIGRRFSGGAISLISVLPFAVIFATYASIMGGESSFNNVFEKIQGIISFGQIKETNHNVKKIIDTLYYIDIIHNSGSNIAAIFGSKDITDKNVLSELLKNGSDTKKAMENLVNNSFLSDNFDLVVKALPPNQIQGIDLTSTTTDVDWVNPVPPELRISLSSSGFANLTKNIAKGLNSGGGNATTEGVAHFFNELQMFSIK